MDVRDLIITPVLLVIIILLAIWIKPLVSNRITGRYFLPGLFLKVIGAITLGLIYQYYYEGGDTFVYFEQGSRYIWEAFLDSPAKALQLIFARGEYDPATVEYASKIIFYHDQPSYFVIRVAGLLDILTLHTYSATAVLFAVISFSGLWAMYLAFYRMYPRFHLEMAIAIFFIPSVVFWGSGILKDPLTLGALGWATFAFYRIFMAGKAIVVSVLILLLSFLVIYEIKIYILLCFIPALLIWLYFSQMSRMKNLVVKIMVLPFSLAVLVAGGYIAVREIGEENRRYNIEDISRTAEATARWLTYVSTREGGSGYSLGDFDYSTSGILRKTPAAIWVTLFRPYIWEAKNPVMLLSALESTIFLLVTLFVLFRVLARGRWRPLPGHPVIIFCFAFAISFAFAVGISTYNFGSLVRYKIPMMPFYVIGLFLLYHLSKRPRKVYRLASREKEAVRVS